eukprot:TRINITY_DN27265_c0_g1_i1.p1 TRINITY_DN27265_c0_g1~~TRINITY_DN27265_c0_g1_i1.p1  ORF type:complete len:1208 (+),score=411.47 TRINITY_DN27265_c0_g1_i1:121-3744(+)
MFSMLLVGAAGVDYNDTPMLDEERAKHVATELGGTADGGGAGTDLPIDQGGDTGGEVGAADVPPSLAGEDACVDDDIDALVTTGGVSPEQAARMKQTAADLAVFMAEEPDTLDGVWPERAEGYTMSQLVMFVILAAMEDYSNLGRIRLMKTVAKRVVEPRPVVSQNKYLTKFKQILIHNRKNEDKRSPRARGFRSRQGVPRAMTSPWVRLTRQEAFLRRIILSAHSFSSFSIKEDFKAFFVEQEKLRAKLISEAVHERKEEIDDVTGQPLWSVIDNLDDIQFITVKPFSERNRHHMPATKVRDTDTLGIIRLINKIDKGAEAQKQKVEAKLKKKQFRLEQLLREEQARRAAETTERNRKIDIERKFMVERLKELYELSERELGYSVFFKAACTGDCMVFKQHLRAHRNLKAVLDARDAHNRMALHFAAYYNQVEVIWYLTKHLRDYHGNDKTVSGYTTLHYAVLGGNLRVVERLTDMALRRGLLAHELYAMSDEGLRARELAERAGQLHVGHYLKHLERRYPVQSLQKHVTSAAERVTRDIIGQETMRITLDAEAAAAARRQRQAMEDEAQKEKEKQEAVRRAEALEALQHCQAVDERRRKEALLEAQRRAVAASKLANYNRRLRIGEDAQSMEMLKMAEEDIDYWGKIVETSTDIYSADDASLLQKAGLSTVGPSTVTSELPHLGLFLTDQQRVVHPQVDTVSYKCVLVLHCVPPCADVDVAPGDVLTSINSMPVETTSDVHTIMKKLHRTGQGEKPVRLVLNGDTMVTVTPVQLGEVESGRFEESRCRGVNKVRTTIPFMRSNYHYPTPHVQRNEVHTQRFGPKGGRFVHKLPQELMREAELLNDKNGGGSGRAMLAQSRSTGWGVGLQTVKVTFPEAKAAVGGKRQRVAFSGLEFYGPGGRVLPVAEYLNPTMQRLFASGATYQSHVPCAVIVTFHQPTIITGYTVRTSDTDPDLDPTYGILSVEETLEKSAKAPVWKAVHVWELGLSRHRRAHGPRVPVYKHSPPDVFFTRYRAALAAEDNDSDAPALGPKAEGAAAVRSAAGSPRRAQTHFSIIAVPPSGSPRGRYQRRDMDHEADPSSAHVRTLSPASSVAGCPFSPTPPRGTPSTARATAGTDADRREAWSKPATDGAASSRRPTPPARKHGVMTTPPVSPKQHPLRMRRASPVAAFDASTPADSVAEKKPYEKLQPDATPDTRRRLRYI